MTRQLSFGKNKSHSGAGGKQWVHPGEALLRGHIVYNVKFLGHVEVEQPKGIEVVKDAIRKMKFNKDLKKAEGQKPPKVELTISVDGVTVQEPKYKVIQHRYPLHRISYCADDKSDKRMFTFIAKEQETAKHHCFVFYSDKCAEEITLTIGQAFDLAYKKFMDSSGKDIDVKKQFLLLQKKVQQLTQENLDLKARVADLERLIDPQALEDFDRNRQSSAPPNSGPPTLISMVEGMKNTKPRSPSKSEPPVVGRRLENLMMPEETRQAPHTNGLASPTSREPVPLLAPPPPVPPRQNMGNSPQAQQMAPQVQSTPQQQQPVDLFGATPFAAGTPPQAAQPQPGGAPQGQDPFGMSSFNPAAGGDIDRQIQSVDRELMDLQIWQESWPWNYMDMSDEPLTSEMLSTDFEDDENAASYFYSP